MPDEGDGSELWVWQEQGADGRWGTIATGITPSNLVVPLAFRSESVARAYVAIAEAHKRSSGHKVRLVRFTLQRVETVL